MGRLLGIVLSYGLGPLSQYANNSLSPKISRSTKNSVSTPETLSAAELSSWKIWDDARQLRVVELDIARASDLAL